MKKKIIIILLMGVFLLTSCGNNENIKDFKEEVEIILEEKETKEIVLETEVMSDKNEPESETLLYSSEIDLEDNKNEILEAYQSALEDFLTLQIYPDGTKEEYDNSYGEMESNMFAIADVDMDWQDELIINFNTSYMAGMKEKVYHYNSETGKLEEEFMAFPFLNYFEGGMIKENWSHNHGMAGNRDDFWPYNLYKYDDNSHTFDMILTVDAWSKDFMENDYEGNPYPTDVDINNVGIVYIISDNSETKILSQEEYDIWFNSTFTRPDLNIEYKTLTKENIETICKDD